MHVSCRCTCISSIRLGDVCMHMNGSFSLVALTPCFSQIPAVQAVAILMF
jgi:hypothetical protein